MAWDDRERRGSDGRRLRLAEARLDVGMQIPEFVPYLGPDPAGHLAADSPTIRAVPELDETAPAAGEPQVLARVAAGRHVVVVDGVPAPARRAAVARDGPARKPNGSPPGLAGLASSF